MDDTIESRDGELIASTTALYVGPIVAEDWASRDMAGQLADEGGPNPYRHFADGEGEALLTGAELGEVIADCSYYVMPDGPTTGDARLRRAYALVLKRAQEARARLAVDRIETSYAGKDNGRVSVDGHHCDDGRIG